MMPLNHLNATPIMVPPFSVVGTDKNSWITHVGLLAREEALRALEPVGAYQMGLPKLGLPTNFVDIAIVAWFEDLSDDELRELATWIELMRTQVDAVDYWILPPTRVYDAVTGRVIRWCFSCASFVAEAYRDAIKLCLVEESILPDVSQGELAAIWGDRLIERAKKREMLPGAGPWPVLLPGYVLHAVAAGRAALPLRPTLSHARLTNVDGDGALPARNSEPPVAHDA